MKSLSFLSALLIPIFNVLSQEIVEVPISVAFGYSMFTPSMVNLRAETDDDLYKAGLTGIPLNLKNVSRHQFIADEKQFWHQSFIRGKIPKEIYDGRMEFLKYDPSKDEISATPLKCFVYIIVGEDEEGNKLWLADTDLDLDFSDEVPRSLYPYSAPYDFETYKKIADNAIQLKYQRLLDGKVVEDEFTLAVALRDNGSLLVNYPQHYKATIAFNDQVYNIAIQSGDFLTRYLKEENNSMIVLKDEDDQKSLGTAVAVVPNQYFQLGDDVYQYLGVDAEQQTVKIRSAKSVDTSQSAQVGYISPEFQGEDFRTGEVVAMDQFKGKYVLLDFWATWCAPCIREFPRLKELSTLYDKSEFEIVGIIGASKPDNVEKLIDKHELTWYQILSDEIVAKYGVVSYPTTFLISPEGVVIDKNLREEALEKRLADLLK